MLKQVIHSIDLLTVILEIGVIYLNQKIKIYFKIKTEINSDAIVYKYTALVLAKNGVIVCMVLSASLTEVTIDFFDKSPIAENTYNLLGLAIFWPEL